MKTLTQYINESVINESRFRLLDKIKNFFKKFKKEEEPKIEDKYPNNPKMWFDVSWGDDAIEYGVEEDIKKQGRKIQDLVFDDPKIQENIVDIYDDEYYDVWNTSTTYIFKEDIDFNEFYEYFVKQFKKTISRVESNLFPETEIKQDSSGMYYYWFQYKNENMFNRIGRPLSLTGCINFDFFNYKIEEQ